MLEAIEAGFILVVCAGSIILYGIWLGRKEGWSARAVKNRTPSWHQVGGRIWSRNSERSSTISTNIGHIRDWKGGFQNLVKYRRYYRLPSTRGRVTVADSIRHPSLR